MPQYSYRCKACRQTYTSLSNTEIPPCPSCNTNQSAGRDYAFSFSMGTREHFNIAAGEYVSNERQLRDSFKRQSDAHSVRMNQTVDYQLIDPSDLKDPSAFGVTEEGLDHTHRVHHDSSILLP